MWAVNRLHDRREMLALAGAVFVSACAGPRLRENRAPLSEVVRRNVIARGGEVALDRVRSLSIVVEIAEGAQTLNGLYAASSDGLVRIDIYAGGNLVGGEGVDREGVWILGANGPQPSVATGAANALTHGADNHLFGWHRFAERGHRLSLQAPQLVDGATYEVVEVRYSTGHVSFFYVDRSSWQAVRRRDERAYHPDVSSTRQRVESRYSDFQSVSGVVAAHRAEDHDIGSGSLLSVNRVLSRTINPSLPADYFARNRPAPSAWPAAG